MFDNAQEPVDIFADTDKPAVRQPVVPGTASTSPAVARYASAARGPSKLLLGIVGLVVLLGAGGAGAYFLMGSKKAPSDQQAVTDPVAADVNADQQVPTEEPPSEQSQPTPPAEEPVTPPPQPEAPVVPPEVATAPPDADSDGLTDAEESQFGTDPQLADTDSDFLTDRDEVVIYKTDPLNPDTDGDSYLDGKEVQGGYNPKGQGKLFDVPPKVSP